MIIWVIHAKGVKGNLQRIFVENAKVEELSEKIVKFRSRFLLVLLMGMRYYLKVKAVRMGLRKILVI